EVITDRSWLEGDFAATVQKRGAAIIEARGKSSAASAANAIIDGVRSQHFTTTDLSWFSSAVISDGNPYGVQEGLIFSFPCQLTAEKNWEIVPGLSWDRFIEEKIRLTEKELVEEKEAVAHLLK
ncbi:MAG: malate dehydrogenase, partial [Simkaniaceae bacterium]|nr:malate dehydrogenase [Simkaniaceae bacterium]